MTESRSSKSLLPTVINSMEGWLTVERAQEMYDLILSVQPKVLVEIGVFGGRSLVAQALALKDLGRGKIIGIDPWKQGPAVAAQTDETQAAWWRDLDFYKIHQSCMEKVWELGLDPHVAVIRACSQDVADLIPKCDSLYIDGGHSEECSCRDVTLYLPKLKQNGILWFDDCDWLSTQKALGLVAEACKLVRDCGGYRLYFKK